MKRFSSTLSIVAVAFALVLGLGGMDTAKAVPAMNGDGYALPAGDVNLYGLDGAGNSARIIVRDPDLGTVKPAPDSYGLSGKSQL